MRGDNSNGASETDFWKLSDISDIELERGLKQLLALGARTEAQVVAHLAEVEARRLHLRAGYRSLFEYCQVALGLSEFEAVFRISAARTALRYPLVFELLARRELHLSAIYLLRQHLNPENHRELLEEARHKSKRQIEELLARRFPRPDIPTNLRQLPSLSPLSPDRYHLELTVDDNFKRKLEHARDLLSHASPSGDLCVVLERGLDALIVRLEKRRFGTDQAVAQREKSSPASPNATHAEPSHRRGTVHANASREAAPLAEQLPVRTPDTGRDSGRAVARPHIATAVRREVADRDEHRCSFTASDGRRCSARAFLQVHHEQAWAHGGPDTPNNLRLLCGQHNRLLAEQAFGVEHIVHAVEQRRQSTSSGDTPPIPDKVA